MPGLVGGRLQQDRIGEIHHPRCGKIGVGLVQAQFNPRAAHPGFGQQRKQRMCGKRAVGVQLKRLSRCACIPNTATRNAASARTSRTSRFIEIPVSAWPNAVAGMFS